MRKSDRETEEEKEAGTASGSYEAFSGRRCGPAGLSNI
jgi:hypothetical protein